MIESSDPETSPETRRIERIHNKSIFDCFNEMLNTKRSYYSVGGTPFPWSRNSKLNPAISRRRMGKEGLSVLLEEVKGKVGVM